MFGALAQKRRFFETSAIASSMSGDENLKPGLREWITAAKLPWRIPYYSWEPRFLERAYKSDTVRSPFKRPPDVHEGTFGTGIFEWLIYGYDTTCVALNSF